MRWRLPYDKGEIWKVFDALSSRYDRVNRLLSGGLDRSWRRALLPHLPPGEGLKLLDIATGTGAQIEALIRSRRVAFIQGIDPAEKMLQIAFDRLRYFSNRIDLAVGDGQALPYPDASFHAATISFGIRNIPDPERALKEMRRVLLPRGRALILEFSLPPSGWMRNIALFYLRRVIPRIGGWCTGDRSAYEYLGKTIESFPSGEFFLRWMEEAGFCSLRAFPMACGAVTLYRGDVQ
jgi:demethylmenaquinone methyltransferase/2-methoxy-6-polyprenyl-1,4-benzoquinol methylase